LNHSYSIVIVCHGEGLDLEVTAAMAMASHPAPLEVIVVDDCNPEPLAPRVQFPGVRCLRTPRQLGAGPAKRFGVEASKGDVAIILDSHMRMPHGWLAEIDKAVTKYPKAIFCTSCVDFNHGYTSDFRHAGAYFSPDHVGFERRWLAPATRGADTCPCVLGACYIVPRRIWDCIDGINPHFYGWGCGEQDLSLKAWLCGYEVRRINYLVVEHRFHRDPKRPVGPNGRMSSWHNRFNELVMAACIFPPEIFKEVYEPFLAQAITIRGGDDAAYTRFRRVEPELVDYGRQLRSRFALRYEDLATCGAGYTVPDICIQTDRLDQLRKEVEKKAKKTPAMTMGHAHREAILAHVPEGGSVLEWGSGESTVWLRRQLKAKNATLVSIEHRPEFAERIHEQAGHTMIVAPLRIQAGRPEAEVVPTGLDATPYLRPNLTQKFDVVLIDGVLRNMCMVAARDYLKEDGTLFLHDAQRDWYEDGKSWWTETAHYRSCEDYPGPTLWQARRRYGHVALQSAS
jgi:GT2 family glycosyltransferase/predicted O-methyltransferase YrrM